MLNYSIPRPKNLLIADFKMTYRIRTKIHIICDNGYWTMFCIKIVMVNEIPGDIIFQTDPVKGGICSSIVYITHGAQQVFANNWDIEPKGKIAKVEHWVIVQIGYLFRISQIINILVDKSLESMSA